MNKILYLTPQAELDLSSIYEYTFLNFGIFQADLYQDDLYGAMLLILKYDELGESFSFSNKVYRKLLVNKHIILYRFESNKCIIVRVLHETMDFNIQFWKG